MRRGFYIGEHVWYSGRLCRIVAFHEDIVQLVQAGERKSIRNDDTWVHLIDIKAMTTSTICSIPQELTDIEGMHDS